MLNLISPAHWQWYVTWKQCFFCVCIAIMSSRYLCSCQSAEYKGCRHGKVLLLCDITTKVIVKLGFLIWCNYALCNVMRYFVHLGLSPMRLMIKFAYWDTIAYICSDLIQGVAYHITSGSWSHEWGSNSMYNLDLWYFDLCCFTWVCLHHKSFADHDMLDWMLYNAGVHEWQAKLSHGQADIKFCQKKLKIT